MVARFEVALPTACLGTVRKAVFLIRVQDSWSASRTKTPGSSSQLPKTTSRRLFQAIFSFLRSPSFFRVFQLFKYQGQSISPLTLSFCWAHMSRSLNLNSLEPIGA
ncbi:hypothetical protein TNCV_3245231 [Trichonephila clavipes]|nr:hypothetical protein TNCV_3245231 [Trichonephila clavipes]